MQHAVVFRANDCAGRTGGSGTGGFQFRTSDSKGQEIVLTKPISQKPIKSFSFTHTLPLSRTLATLMSLTVCLHNHVLNPVGVGDLSLQTSIITKASRPSQSPMFVSSLVQHLRQNKCVLKDRDESTWS